MGGSDAEVEVKAAAAEAEEEDTGTGADPTAGSRSSSPQLELEPQPQPQPQSQKEADSSGGNGDRKPQSVSGLASPGMVGLRLDSVENGEGAGEASQRPLTTSAAALASGGKPHHVSFRGTTGQSSVALKFNNSFAFFRGLFIQQAQMVGRIRAALLGRSS